MQSIETITRRGKKFVVCPLQEFKKLLLDAEMLNDIQAYDMAKAHLKNGDGLVPLSLVKRRLAGENTVKIWREYRGMTQEKLAVVSGVSRGMVGAIEAGHKKPGIGSLKKLAKALRCDLDDLS